MAWRFWRRGRLPSRVSDELRAELKGPPGFMYPWRLTEDIEVPAMHPELPSVHATREELIEPTVKTALLDGRARVIDLGAHEGYFSHRALDWGAAFVLAVDVRTVNTRRAKLLRDHYGISSDALKVRTASVYDLDADELGLFDVVLALGLIYHLENPIGALRVARALAKPGGLVVVEAQLTRQDAPIQVGWGITSEYSGEAASWAARFEEPEVQENTPLAAYGGVISLIPNRAALIQAMEVVGLTRIAALPAAPHHNSQYRTGDRAVVVGWAPATT
jgi:tRNA (mo5U34)-methyltransferase